MRKRQWGDEYRTTVICVDSFDQGVPSGRICNPVLNGGKTFHGVLELLREMESMMDKMEHPQSFTARRSFQPPTDWTAGSAGNGPSRQGELATFFVRILFRRNTSWQGTVDWLEEDQKENFRSVLELLLLIDSALRGD